MAEYVTGPNEEALLEEWFARGWTDGLPIVVPTPGRVEQALATVEVPPDKVLGTIVERGRSLTVETVAINAVMAGCLPAYFPVVLAAVEAMCDPAFGVHGVTISTQGAAVLVIVNGPVTRQLNLNARDNLFGPGWRANSTIGRAIRLVIINGLGGVPGVLDRATFGHGGKYSSCIAEDEAGSPWSPLHVERGFDSGESVVTVMAAQAPVQVANDESLDPEAIVHTLGDAMRQLGIINYGDPRQICVVVGAQHAEVFRAHGWDKSRLRAALFAAAHRPLRDLQAVGKLAGRQDIGGDLRIPVVPEPEDILIVQGGGAAGGYTAVLVGWTNGPGPNSTQAVSKRSVAKTVEGAATRVEESPGSTGPVVACIPTAVLVAKEGRVAGRVLSLRGLRVGILDNGGMGVGRFLHEVFTELEPVGVRGPVVFRKPLSSQSLTKAMVEEIAQHCDVVITGIGH